MTGTGGTIRSYITWFPLSVHRSGVAYSVKGVPRRGPPYGDGPLGGACLDGLSDWDIEAQRISPTGVVGADIQIFRAPAIYAAPTGIVFHPLDGLYSGPFAVSYVVYTLISQGGLFDGHVAVVNGSNALTRIYRAGEGTGAPMISTDGPEGFALTYAMTTGSTGDSHIYGQFGSYF
jgi:hypothetical protein